MGRGRAKAKQTKVARQLKYGTVSTDLSALQSELTSGQRSMTPAQAVPVDDVDDNVEDDPYAKYYDETDDDTRAEGTSGP